MGVITFTDASLSGWLGVGFVAITSFILGFAINRGTICTVIATAELVEKKRPGRSIALLEAALWAGSLYAILKISPSIPDGWLPFGYIVLGTVLFALGSYVNNACVFGSIGHLGNGRIEFAFVFIGIFIATFLAPFTQLLPAHPPLHMKLPAGGVVFLIALPLVLSARLAMTRPSEKDALSLTLSMGAAGISFALLAAFSPQLSLTALIESAISVPVAGAAAMIATPLGSVISALFRERSVKFVWPTWKGSVQRLGGGMLMGLGAALIPGGNDTLLLVGLPGAAWQALFSYALLVGILTALIAVFGRRKFD